MRTIASHKAVLRATSATLCLALFSAPADAQLRPGAEDRAAVLNAGRANPATPDNAPAAPAQPRRRRNASSSISPSRGTQRVEPGTVLTYVNIREGDTYDPAAVDQALKALFGTGLFSDVKINFNNGTLAIRVVENPILNQVVFEGNDKVSDQGPHQGSPDQAARHLHPRPVSGRCAAHHRALPPQRQIRRPRRSADHSAAAEPRRSDLLDHRRADHRHRPHQFHRQQGL